MVRAPLVLRDPRSGLLVELDPHSGLLTALVGAGDQRVPMTADITLFVGGGERRGVTGGLVYPGVRKLSGSTLLGLMSVAADGVRTVRTEVAGWQVCWHWQLREQAPRIRLAVEVVPPVGADPLRNLTLELSVGLDAAEPWRLHAPGNRVRADVAAASVTPPVGISPAGGLRGSTGLVALSRDEQPLTVVAVAVRPARGR